MWASPASAAVASASAATTLLGVAGVQVTATPTVTQHSGAAQASVELMMSTDSKAEAFRPAVKAQMSANIAAKAGVDPSAVTIEVVLPMLGIMV